MPRSISIGHCESEAVSLARELTRNVQHSEVSGVDASTRLLLPTMKDCR